MAPAVDAVGKYTKTRVSLAFEPFLENRLLTKEIEPRRSSLD
jgi:hypothetical protein